MNVQKLLQFVFALFISTGLTACTIVLTIYLIPSLMGNLPGNSVNNRSASSCCVENALPVSAPTNSTPAPAAVAQSITQQEASPIKNQPVTQINRTFSNNDEEESLAKLGREVAIVHHLQDGEEYTIPTAQLLGYGQQLFQAVWTVQEGAGRPFTNGTGKPLADHADPLLFPRNFNRISGPDANSCAGCHNTPFGVPGGGGDIVANVFVLAQRFDFVTFDQADIMPNKGAVNEFGKAVTLQNVGNNRATIGMYGSGFIEMLARQITAELQALRDSIQPGGEQLLTSKGINFGILKRNADGSWNTNSTVGLPITSLVASAPDEPPSLLILPFHQAGAVVSLRQFSNTAFNQHHGIQSTERFGIDKDEDGDGFANELTRADITAVTLFQATMAVPGRVIPRDPVFEEAIWVGEQKFQQIGCADCHLPQLPLDQEGWIFAEPGPYNPTGNLRAGDTPPLQIDLTSDELPQPRLKVDNGVVYVPAFTDFKLHDITNEPYDPNVEPINMHGKAGSSDFFAGNRHFITRRLWGAANEPPYFHHGLYTTLREAILAHGSEALAARTAFEELSQYEQKSMIEFLKSLQILPPGPRSLIIDDQGNPREWPPHLGQ